MPQKAPILGVVVVLTLSLVAAGGTVVAQSDSGTVTITVAVRDRVGEPIANAELDAEWDGGSTTATTANNGKAFVDVPAGARVRITVTHPEYVRNRPYVVPDASEREVEVTAYLKSSVRLVVGDGSGPVANASVLIERNGVRVATGETDGNGVFQSGVIQAGEYEIIVNESGYYTERKSLSVTGNVTNRVALRSGSVPVRVTVADPHFDPPRPVNDATVALADIGTVQADRQGTVTVTAPVNTPTTLRVTKDGYRTVERDVTIGETSANLTVELSRTRNITLETANERIVAGERIVLTATDAYGDPLPSGTVFLDGERAGTTDDEGEASIPIPEPGEHTLYVTRNGVRSNEVQVEAIDAGDGDVTTGAPTASATPTDSGGSGGAAPGFGPALAVLAVIGAALLTRRRRSE